MNNLRARILLTLYRSLGYFLNFVLRFYLYIAVWLSKNDRVHLSQSLALGKKTKSKNPLIWVHGVSVGETVALIPLIQKLKEKKFQILLTTGTKTSSQLVKLHFGDEVIHQYAPLDLPPVIDRFIDHWQPVMAIIGEAEIWPIRIVELYKRRIFQICVNAHMSDRSYSRWTKYKKLFSHYLFSKFDLCLCQTEQDVEKYLALGAKAAKITGNLKVESPPLGRQEDFDFYKNSLEGRAIWAAISTHKGEERVAFDVHKALKPHFENLLTVIVPRYLDDIEEMVDSLQKKGFVVAQRSKGENIDENIDIFIGDTIGEMGLYLQFTDIVFMGKSLIEKGGHNPLEPAFLGKAIISGPYVENFQEIYGILEQHEAVLMVKNATDLALKVNNLLTQQSLLASMQKNAKLSICTLAGPLEKTMKALEPFLESIILQQGLNNVQQSKY